MGYLSCKAQSSISTSEQQQHHHHRRKILHFSHRQLESATSNFAESSLLGRGSHGSVFLASLPSGLLLAVKRPSRSPSEVDNEIHVLSRLLPSSSPDHLVHLVGFTPDPLPHRLLVIEYMPNGTLFDLLHSRLRPPSWSLRLRLALHAARALRFLHSHRPPVIHRDVKSANVLLDSRLNARLGDFGLAVFAGSAPFLTPPAGTLGYLDPGYVTPEKLSTKTDVFSFGILLLEIMSGRKAIDVTHSPPSIVEWAVPLMRRGRISALFDPRIPPPRDPVARRQLAMLAASCVRSSRDKRPSMEDVVERLEVLRKSVSSSGWNGLYVGNPCSAVDTERRAHSKKRLDEDVLECDESSGEESGGSCPRELTEAAQEDDMPSSTLDAYPPPVVSIRSSRNARRVFSEASATRRNLMDLMKAPNEEIIRYRGSGSAVRNGVGIRRARTLNLSHDYYDKENPSQQMRRNRSMRSTFETLSLREKDVVPDERIPSHVPR